VAMKVVAVIGKHAIMNNEPCAITAFFDINTYLFLLLLKISQHCLNCVSTNSKWIKI